MSCLCVLLCDVIYAVCVVVRCVLPFDVNSNFLVEGLVFIFEILTNKIPRNIRLVLLFFFVKRGKSVDRKLSFYKMLLDRFM